MHWRIDETRIVLIPSSLQLEAFGLPNGWYLNWTFLFIPEKCPYLDTNNWLTISIKFCVFFFKSNYISRTHLSCKSFVLVSLEGSVSLLRSLHSCSSFLAISSTSCSWEGRFIFRWPCFMPPYFSNKSKNLEAKKSIYQTWNTLVKCFKFSYSLFRISIFIFCLGVRSPCLMTPITQRNSILLMIQNVEFAQRYRENLRIC